MTDLGLSTHCRLAGPGVHTERCRAFSQDAVWRISYSFMTAGEDGSGRRMMGGEEMGRGWQIGEIALPGKGKEIGRYWCDEKVGYWAREEKEMCPGGATCLPLLGNVLAPLGQRACPKTGQKTV